MTSSVMIVESPGVDDAVHGRAEGPAVSEILKVLGVGTLHRTVFDERELQTAAQLFNRGDFNVLHISAHGSADGIELSNGHFVRWSSLFDLFHLGPGHILSLSSCNTLQEHKLLDIARALDVKLGAVFAYDDAVTWADAALATVLLMRSWVVGQEDFSHVSSAMASVFLATGVNVHGAIFNNSDESDPRTHIVLSGKDWLESYMRAAFDHEAPDMYHNLLRDRGVLFCEGAEQQAVGGHGD
ncbi:MAG: hypothetical protein AAFX05_13730 [Planctomycetota bacterium]